MWVQAELDETKIVLHKTIESVLEQGEKLDSLVDRSEALSPQSKLFYKTAKKQVCYGGHGADVEFVLTRGSNSLADIIFNYEGCLIVIASD